MTLMSRSEWLVPMVDDFLDAPMPKTQLQVGGQASESPDVRCVIGTLPLAIQTNALIEEPLVRVPGGLSATLPLSVREGLPVTQDKSRNSPELLSNLA